MINSNSGQPIWTNRSINRGADCSKGHDGLRWDGTGQDKTGHCKSHLEDMIVLSHAFKSKTASVGVRLNQIILDCVPVSLIIVIPSPIATDVNQMLEHPTGERQ